MTTPDPDIRDYVERKSQYMTGAEIHRRLRAMLELWTREERMKMNFTILALTSFLILVILPLILKLRFLVWGILAWTALLVALCAWYWRKSGKLEK
jgi:hypothetical protein